jgi:cytochrome c556
MRNHHRRGWSVAAALLLIAGLVSGPARSPSLAGQPEKRTRGEFMRQKLEFSKNVLEGLSLEEYGMIEKNAKALKTLSQAAEWEVPTIPNATDYVALTTEFQRYADELARNAKQKNIDGATLAYLKLTMSCVQCHKFVRFASR